MTLADPVTLYSPDGEKVTTSTRAELVRWRASGYTVDPPFDPAEHNVEEVQKHLAAHPEDAPRVVAVEKVTKARKTLVGGESTSTDAGDAGNTGTSTE